MLTYLVPMWPLVAATLTLTLVTSALGQIPQLANRYLIDEVLVPGDTTTSHSSTLFTKSFTVVIQAVLRAGHWSHGALPTLVVLALGLLVLRLVTSGIGFVRSYATRILGQRLTYALRRDIFRKVQYLSSDFYIHAGIGEIMSRVMNDTNTMQNFITSNVNQILAQIFTFITGLLIMEALDPHLTDLLLLFGPPIAGCILLFNDRLRNANRFIRRQTARLTAAVHDALAGFITIKTFGVEEHVIQSFETENLGLFDRQLASMRLQAAYNNTMGLVTGSSAAFFLMYGGLQVIHHEISLGTYVLINGMRNSLFIPFTSFAGLAAQYQRAAAGGERIFEYLDTEPSVRDRPGATPLPPIRGNIEFDNIVFCYPTEPDTPEDAQTSPLASPLVSSRQYPREGRGTPDRGVDGAEVPIIDSLGDYAPPPLSGYADELLQRSEEVPPPPAIDGISFRIAAGETVGLVGPSGGGKSTIAALIARLYDPTSGSIRLDGHDIRDVTLHSLRSQIAIVLQDVYLFRASIRDNVAFGFDDVRPEAVDEALRAANAHFVWDLPDGPETIVGEGGLRLSGGQRQRIAIARALLRHPRILMLDEATSAQDTLSENAVMEALKARHGETTIIVIAHRLSTITYADRILVVDRGHLVEEGRHEELLAAGGLYAALYGAQAHGGGPHL